MTRKCSCCDNQFLEKPFMLWDMSLRKLVTSFSDSVRNRNDNVELEGRNLTIMD